MIIHEDHNGVRVISNAVTDDNGNEIAGQSYVIEYGSNHIDVPFQVGNSTMVGVTGITNEALLAMMIHRTELLNSNVSCPENQRAISYMKSALLEFNARTISRMVRGVEGKPVV